ncbi:Bgt-20869, partial [Blumeria graminis f. sp. tritici]
SGNESNKANTYHRPLHNSVKHILIKPLFVCNSSPHNHNNTSLSNTKIGKNSHWMNSVNALTTGNPTKPVIMRHVALGCFYGISFPLCKYYSYIYLNGLNEIKSQAPFS